jgi:hypothetical protein
MNLLLIPLPTANELESRLKSLDAKLLIEEFQQNGV